MSGTNEVEFASGGTGTFCSGTVEMNRIYSVARRLILPPPLMTAETFNAGPDCRGKKSMGKMEGMRSYPKII